MSQHAETVDGELLPLEQARKTCQRNKFPIVPHQPTHLLTCLCRALFYAGFAFLPFFWLVNVWLFWPYFAHGGDSVLTTYTRRSALGFLVSCCIFLPWMLTFMIGQEAAVGAKVFRKMDVLNWDITDYISFS